MPKIGLFSSASFFAISARSVFCSVRSTATALRARIRQPESAGKLAELAVRLRERVVEAALADRKVQRRLAKTRYRVIGADYAEEKGAGGGTLFHFPPAHLIAPATDPFPCE